MTLTLTLPKTLPGWSAYVKFGLDRPSRLAGHTEQTNRQTDKHNAFYHIDKRTRRKLRETFEVFAPEKNFLWAPVSLSSKYESYVYESYWKLWYSIYYVSDWLELSYIHCSLGALHDGDRNPCISSSQNVMASGPQRLTNATISNPFYFSTCSINYFRHYLASLTAYVNRTQTIHLQDSACTLKSKLFGGNPQQIENCRLSVKSCIAWQTVASH